MTRKTTKIIYWVSTAVFAAVFATTGSLYLAHSARFVGRLSALGYPVYVLNILGTAKLLGVVMLLAPKVPVRLKEWAYAGFVFDFGGAIWSHLAVHDPLEAAPLVIPIAIGAVSYVSYHRLRSNTE